MVFDTKNLNTLTIHELALLLLLYDERVDKSRTVVTVKEEDIFNALESLRQRGFITSAIYKTDFNYKPPYRKLSWNLLEKGKNALAENCAEEKVSKKAMSEKAITERCRNLAPKLMELYPVGTKPGTSLKWRGATEIVVNKLKKLISSGNEFTDEEAILATKNYIGAFNGMYTTMRVLPYFLSKNEIVGGESKKTSDFMSYVEDLRTNDGHPKVVNDWDITLR